MAITIIKGAEGTYKTTLMFQIIRDLVINAHPHYYKPSDLITNVYNYIPNSTYLNNNSLINYILEAKHSTNILPFKHKIIAIDEIDAILGQRGYTDKKQTEVAKFTWQSRHLFWYIIGTYHLSLGIDTEMRQQIRYEYIAKGYQPQHNRTKAIFIDVAHHIPCRTQYFYRTTDAQKMFDSWKIVL